MTEPTKHAEFIRWIPLLLDTLRALGGSAEPRDTYDLIANAANLSPTEREKRNKSGNNRFHNQVQWARQYLMWEGFIDGSRRGFWTLTPEGAKTKLTIEQSRLLVQKWVRNQAEARGVQKKSKNIPPDIDGESETVVEAEENELLTS